MSYMQLIGVSVDTGGLEEALGTLTEKVRELENGKDIDALVESAVKDKLSDMDIDEDRVQDLIASYVNDNTLMGSRDVDEAITRALNDAEVLDADGVRDIFREMAHDEGEDMVRDIIANEGYITESDVDEKIRNIDPTLSEDDVQMLIHDALEDQNFASDSTVQDLSRRIDDLSDEMPDADEIVNRVISELPDNEDVARLEKRVADMERRFEVYATRVDEQGQTVRALNERLDIMAERLGDNNVTNALTLLDLLKRAAQILGIGGRA
jgi:uncharacterized coiled-coil protein SlyX/polyhydroxyalkanoate synthesis regulator phasin